jgi:uncharacterized membrane-anchored protein
MSHPPLDTVVRAAKAQGLLPPEATIPFIEKRPWPVVLLTALGAWLAAIPLLSVIGLLLGDLAARGAGTYAVGALLLAGAVIVLRRPEVPVFLEQLAIPALLSGAGALGFALARDLPDQAAAAVLALLALAIAQLINRPWLRVLLGVAAASCVALALWPGRLWHAPSLPGWWAVLHAMLGLWLLALATQRRFPGSASLLESVGSGWLLATLAGLAAFSGMAFLAPGVLGGGFVGAVALGLAGTLPTTAMAWVQHGLSATLATAGGAVLTRAWPSLAQRNPWGGRPAALFLAALCMAALAFFIPTLGAAVLALALMLATRRWRLAGAAGLAAVWMLGSFYYALAWPLAQKAVMLVACGAALGLLAWRTLRQGAPADAGQPTPRSLPAMAAVALTVLATVVVAQGAIREKEGLIARGRPIYVRLAPVDPRSLMQGDYMRLNFALPEAAARVGTGLLNGLSGQRPYVVAQLDTRGVATLPRLHQPGEALGADELRIELSPKNGQWTLVTDAWFFREGEAERWQRARFGEFRVGADGRALLVGLADDKLTPIRP